VRAQAEKPAAHPAEIKAIKKGLPKLYDTGFLRYRCQGYARISRYVTKSPMPNGFLYD
jgi:hypothetical protein